MTTIGEITKWNEQKLLDYIRNQTISEDSVHQRAIYRELNRRSVKKAAEWVIVAAVITGLVTVVVQLIELGMK